MLGLDETSFNWIMTDKEIIEEWARACAAHTAGKMDNYGLYMMGSMLMSMARLSGLRDMHNEAQKTLRPTLSLVRNEEVPKTRTQE